jgi:Zn-dependent protease with chaperone function
LPPAIAGNRAGFGSQHRVVSSVGFSDHAVQRFAERAGLGTTLRARVEPIIRDLLLQEGFVTLPFAWMRFKIGLFIGIPGIMAFVHSHFLAVWIIFGLSFFGIIRTLVSLIWPVGAGWWWRNAEGGREPSGPEQVSYTDAPAELMSLQDDVRPPRQWFVLDNPAPGATVCGDTLMLNRGLLTSSYLTPVLAHELGHLNTIDGNLTCALNRVIFKEPRRNPQLEAEFPPGLFTILWRTVMWFLRGGLGIKLLGPAWAVWWREREYAADKYAADLGYGSELADYLEENALFYDRPVPFMWLTLHSHPSTELRIDRLRGPFAALTDEELDELELELDLETETEIDAQLEPEAEVDGKPDPEAALEQDPEPQDGAS